jgi:hypothetical protein
MAPYLERWRVPIFQLARRGVLEFGNAVLKDAFELGQCRPVPVGFQIELPEGFAKEIEEISIRLEGHGWETSFAGAAVHGTSPSLWVV